MSRNDELAASPEGEGREKNIEQAAARLADDPAFRAAMEGFRMLKIDLAEQAERRGEVWQQMDDICSETGGDHCDCYYTSGHCCKCGIVPEDD